MGDPETLNVVNCTICRTVDCRIERVLVSFKSSLSREESFKGTPPTRDFDTDTDSGMAAMGLPKANHGPE